MCHVTHPERMEEGGMKLPVTVVNSFDNQTVQEWEFPSWSFGDDVFYPGEGTVEHPIEKY